MTGAYAFRPLLADLARQVEAWLPHQILDPVNPGYGAFIVPGYGFPVADHTASADALAQIGYAYLCEASPLAGDPRLLERLRPALAFQRRAQHPSGLIDLPRVDFESPPDTAFVVQLLAPLCALARTRAEAGLPGATDIANELGAFVHAAALGIAGHGFRTPNHRWVVCSALTQAMALFPNLAAATVSVAARRAVLPPAAEATDLRTPPDVPTHTRTWTVRQYVNEILAETVDINADGEYSERSTGIYSAVCNRSLRLVADSFARPDLLAPVRANLDFTAGLIDADGAVETGISLRQDNGRRVVPITMADSFFDMGMRDGRGDWLELADRLVATHRRHGNGASTPAWLVHPFVAHAHARQPRPSTSAPVPPADGARLYPASRFWRVRRGETCALALARQSTAFRLRHGCLSLEALRIKGAYLHCAGFEADEIEPIPGGVRLLHLAARRELPGWDLPLGRPVCFANPHRGYYPLVASGTREQWPLPPLDMALDVGEVPGGFDLRLESRGGFDDIPVVVEWYFAAGGTLVTAAAAWSPRAGDDVLLQQGRAIYHDASHAIAVGPGSAAHRLLALTNGPSPSGCFRLAMALLSPLDARLTIRVGRWSEATRDIYDDRM